MSLRRPNTPATVAEVVNRLHAGEPVEPLDLVAAEAAERIDAITAGIEAKRAAERQREADRVEAERLLAEFATDADELNARLVTALDTLDAAAAEVDVIRADMDRVIRERLDALRRVGVHLERDTIDLDTNGRVLLSPGQLGRSVFKVNASQDYARWLATHGGNLSQV